MARSWLPVTTCLAISKVCLALAHHRHDLAREARGPDLRARWGYLTLRRSWGSEVFGGPCPRTPQPCLARRGRGGVSHRIHSPVLGWALTVGDEGGSLRQVKSCQGQLKR